MVPICIRKSLMSVISPPEILGPEMAASILWAPGVFWFFLLENPHAHKIPCFRGGRVLGFSRGGGLEVPILFLWAWGFFRLYDMHSDWEARRLCKSIPRTPVLAFHSRTPLKPSA